jgi:hypothetical protein
MKAVALARHLPITDPESLMARESPSPGRRLGSSLCEMGRAERARSKLTCLLLGRESMRSEVADRPRPD